MSQDAKRGGDLFEMAKDGTSLPNDAGKQNIIPSKASDAQRDLGEAEADNPLNMSDGAPTSRGGGVGEGMTGTGDALPASTTEKYQLNGGKEDNYTPAPKGGRNT